MFLYTEDPICQAGLGAALSALPGVRLVGAGDIDAAQVAVIFADVVDERIARLVRAVQRDGSPRVVLIATEVDEQGVATAAECGVVGIVRRREATPERLLAALRITAAGDGVLPPDLVGGLLRRIKSQPVMGESLRGEPRPRLSEREVTVLQMISDGCETREIARRMCYSERTVKNIIQDVTQRFGVKNRSHAVAFAVRNGLL